MGASLGKFGSLDLDALIQQAVQDASGHREAVFAVTRVTSVAVSTPSGAITEESAGETLPDNVIDFRAFCRQLQAVSPQEDASENELEKHAHGILASQGFAVVPADPTPDLDRAEFTYEKFTRVVEDPARQDRMQTSLERIHVLLLAFLRAPLIVDFCEDDVERHAYQHELSAIHGEHIERFWEKSKLRANHITGAYGGLQLLIDKLPLELQAQMQGKLETIRRMGIGRYDILTLPQKLNLVEYIDQVVIEALWSMADRDFRLESREFGHSLPHQEIALMIASSRNRTQSTFQTAAVA